MRNRSSVATILDQDMTDMTESLIDELLTKRAAAPPMKHLADIADQPAFDLSETILLMVYDSKQNTMAGWAKPSELPKAIRLALKAGHPQPEVDQAVSRAETDYPSWKFPRAPGAEGT